MTTKAWGVFLLSAAVLLGGCAQVQKLTGKTKTPPDEFAVYSRAPLSLPPDYGLRPPSPGQVRPQEAALRNQTQALLLGGLGAVPATRNVPQGPGIQALLRETGAINADPNIRSIINQETSNLVVEDRSITERIMFWNTPNAYGTIVDPVKETRRIRENMALGRPITEGETPTIERKEKALLEGLFQ